MKAMTKKMGAIVLAMALCLSLCCTALAAETQTYSSSDDTKFTIVINPAYSGETYSAFKIFDVTYKTDSDDNVISYSYTIDETSPWYAQVAAATDVFFLTDMGDGVYNVTLVDGVEDEAVIAVFNNKLPSDAVAVATETADTVINGDGSTGSTSLTLDVTSGGPGYYYITTSLGTVVTINTTSPTVEVADKNTPPTLDKTVDSVNSESIENDTKEVEYEFKIGNVHGIHHLVLEDEMEITDEGVTYEFDKASLKVVLYDDGQEPVTLELDKDYVVQWKGSTTDTEGEPDNCDFHVIFTVNDVDYDFSDCSNNAYVMVTVNCTLHAEGATFEGDEITIPNTAVVTFGNGGNTKYDEAVLYEYGFQVYKYDGTTEEPLAGAQFTLTNKNDTQDNENYDKTAYFLYEEDLGIYLLEGWGDIPEGYEDTYTSVLESPSSGYIKIEGLDIGIYQLTETKAPEGYNLLTESITIDIVADENNPGSFTVNNSYTHVVNVINNEGQELPDTGGIGTTIFYIIGGVLVAGAVVVLITRRRMSSEG